MAEQTPCMLNHFALFAFTPEYWALASDERRRILRAWRGGLGDASDVQHFYQTYPLETMGDLVVWSALREQRPEAPAEFFGRFAAATAPYRSYLTVRDTLWGFTHPSQYTKTRSRQEADPFGPERRRYLIIYPFAKTADWYLETQEKRQLMMSGHIKIGKQYEDINQLLLYSFGLQDHEFVVVYETEDLTRFSSLVAELRGTEARRYTLRDAPLHVGVHQPDMDALTAWL